MANTSADMFGVVVELDNDETNKLLGSLPAGMAGAGVATQALTQLGVPAVPAGIIGTALVVHLAWESEVIKAANKGDGVILTFVYVAPGVVVPRTRVAPDIDPNWAAKGEGTFVSKEGDRVRYHVDHGVVDPATVTFRLVNQSPSQWDKSLVLRDGQGSQWEIRSTVSAAGEESLWAGQVQFGQQITFRKPQTPGRWVDAFSVGGLEGLQPGDKALFTWVE
jgi:hypothetical protein